MQPENIFLLAFFTTVCFIIMQIIKMKYMDKEYKPLKEIITEGIIVFSSALVAAYGVFYMNGSITDFMNVITETKTLNLDAAQVFTDTPTF
jgi:hypothetical protein